MQHFVMWLVLRTAQDKSSRQRVRYRSTMGAGLRISQTLSRSSDAFSNIVSRLNLLRHVSPITKSIFVGILFFCAPTFRHPIKFEGSGGGSEPETAGC